MTAAQLLAAGLLLPQNLTDEELSAELAGISVDTGPITRRMLHEEQNRRIEKAARSLRPPERNNS